MPLDAVDTPPGARDRGTVIHGAIGDYTEKFAARPPADPLKELLKLGEKHFAKLEDFPEARAFWWPRFVRIAQWFAQWDDARRDGLAALACGNPRRTEIPGRPTRVHALGHRRPHRAAPGGLRHPRLQDRRRAHRKAGAHGARAAIDAGSRHPARRRLQGRARRSGVGTHLCDAQRRRAGRQAERDQLQGRHARHASRARAGAAQGTGGEVRERSGRPIARWCIRCGRRTTATTTTSPASRNGRRPAVGRTSCEPPAPSRPTCAACRSRPPTRTYRPSSPPMPARARPMCWRSASSICCCAASIRPRSSASPSPRPPPPIWRTRCSSGWPAGPRSTTPRSTKRSRFRPARKPDARGRARARRLFASALETPGGLKVQTIHAFCTRLLHQFPFEANVAARFTVLDEASTTQLLDQIDVGCAAGSLGQAGRRTG